MELRLHGTANIPGEGVKSRPIQITVKGGRVSVWGYLDGKRTVYTFTLSVSEPYELRETEVRLGERRKTIEFYGTRTGWVYALGRGSFEREFLRLTTFDDWATIGVVLQTLVAPYPGGKKVLQLAKGVMDFDTVTDSSRAAILRFWCEARKGGAKD